MPSTDYAHNINPFTTDMLDLLFDQMPMGVVILNADYVVLRYNATWAGYFERYNPSAAPRLQSGVSYLRGVHKY